MDWLIIGVLDDCNKVNNFYGDSYLRWFDWWVFGWKFSCCKFLCVFLCMLDVLFEFLGRFWLGVKFVIFVKCMMYLLFVLKKMVLVIFDWGCGILGVVV